MTTPRSRIESSDFDSLPTSLVERVNTLKLSRVFRFTDPETGAPQISDFPENDPTGDTPLEIRMKHFTEIENFSFLGFVLAHELGGTIPRPIRTVANLDVSDPEFRTFVNQAQNAAVTDEELGDAILDVGINWEHFVASNDNLLIPDHPTKITDTLMQEKIDSLDVLTEALVREVNLRSIEQRIGTPSPKSRSTRSRRGTKPPDTHEVDNQTEPNEIGTTEPDPTMQNP
jgi:hypothetical protein